jgi:TRAP-type C4-dicarboxylate transport system permease small subunit
MSGEVQSMKKFLSRIVEDVCFVLVVVLAVVVFFQVFNRFILKAPMAWTEELAMLLFQWVVFLGAAVGVKRMSHFGIDLLVEKLSEKTRHRIDLIVPFAVGAIAMTLIVEGFKLLKLTQYQLYTTMDISHAWATAAMPISGFLMMFYLIRHEIRIWKRKEGGQNV